MKTRNPPIPDETGERYWTVVLKKENQEHRHLFRFPSYTKALALRRMAKSLGEELDLTVQGHLPDLADDATPKEKAEHLASQLKIMAEQNANFYATSEQLLPMFGAVLGQCWHNRGLKFEAIPPKSSKLDALCDYGEKIIDEMQDKYSMIDIQTLGNVCLTEITRRLDTVYLAASKADFFVEGQTPKSPLQKAADEAYAKLKTGNSPTIQNT